MNFQPISSANEKSKIYVAAMVMLVVAYFAFPVAMGLAYAAMVFAFLLGLASWKIIRPNSELLKSPLVLASVGLYILIAIGWLYSSASWDDAKLHFSKYAKLILIPVFFCCCKIFDGENPVSRLLWGRWHSFFCRCMRMYFGNCHGPKLRIWAGGRTIR